MTLPDRVVLIGVTCDASDNSANTRGVCPVRLSRALTFLSVLRSLRLFVQEGVLSSSPLVMANK